MKINSLKISTHSLKISLEGFALPSYILVAALILGAVVAILQKML